MTQLIDKIYQEHQMIYSPVNLKVLINEVSRQTGLDFNQARKEVLAYFTEPKTVKVLFA